MRLGWFPEWPQGAPSKCPCGKPGSDLRENPVHPLHCEKNKRTAINRRHDGIVQTIAAVFRAARCQVQVEPASCFFDDNEHPDIRIVAGFATLMVDVSVGCPQATSYLQGKGELVQGAVAKARESEKSRKYSRKCEDRGWVFVPAVFETLGLRGKAQKAILTTLMKVCEDVAPFSVFRSLYTQGCAAALARGNADVMEEGKKRTELNRFYLEQRADACDEARDPPVFEEGEKRPTRPPLVGEPFLPNPRLSFL